MSFVVFACVVRVIKMEMGKQVIYTKVWLENLMKENCLGGLSIDRMLILVLEKHVENVNCIQLDQDSFCEDDECLCSIVSGKC
jgi:hypothetical protein